MLALFLDLEHKLYVWRLYTTFEPLSPMSWGAWILLLVYPVLRRRTSSCACPGRCATGCRRWARSSDRLVATPGAACAGSASLNMVSAWLLGIYTGILLSALGARPLWNSALLGPLFLVSGLSAARGLRPPVAPRRGRARAAGQGRQRVPDRRAGAHRAVPDRPRCRRPRRTSRPRGSSSAGRYTRGLLGRRRRPRHRAPARHPVAGGAPTGSRHTPIAPAPGDRRAAWRCASSSCSAGQISHWARGSEVVMNIGFHDSSTSDRDGRRFA